MLILPSSAALLNRRGLLALAGAWGVSWGASLLSPRQARARGLERPTSLLTIWLSGGPSQLETWDPHPGSVIGGDTQAIDTSLPGVQIAGFYPQLAEQLAHLNVLRSLVSKEGDHERGTYLVKTGYRPDPTLVHPAVGAIVAHERPNAEVRVPLHVSLNPRGWPARGGYLGDQLDAFKVFDPRGGLTNVKAQVDAQRQERRVAGLQVLEQAFRKGRHRATQPALHADTVRRALDMMGSEQLAAFEIDGEPEGVKSAYGDTSFGRGCLAARRLLERGVRAIEVTLDGFDSHVNNYETHKARGAELDPALATLVRELVERDLFQSTVLLVVGEFGRTPRINPAGGRDHWPGGFSCLLGGGGLQRGRVLGATDPTGERTQPERPIEIADLYATILETLGIDFTQEHLTPIGRPMAYSQGTPIEELLAG